MLYHQPIDGGVFLQLDPLSLQLLWIVPKSSSVLTLVEPQEDIFVITDSPSAKAPFSLAMAGYEMENPSSISWQWSASFDTFATFSFAGIAGSPFGYAPLACASMTVWNKQQTDSETTFFCLDTITQTVSLTFTTSPHKDVVLASLTI